MVSIMSSASRASAPSNSVTSGQRCFRPRSPKTRMGKVGMAAETTGRAPAGPEPRWSDPQRVHLGPEAAGGTAGGQGPGQAAGEDVGGRRPDENGAVGPGGDADATGRRSQRGSCRGQGRRVTGEAGQGGVGR